MKIQIWLEKIKAGDEKIDTGDNELMKIFAACKIFTKDKTKIPAAKKEIAKDGLIIRDRKIYGFLYGKKKKNWFIERFGIKKWKLVEKEK